MNRVWKSDVQFTQELYEGCQCSFCGGENPEVYKEGKIQHGLCALLSLDRSVHL